MRENKSAIILASMMTAFAGTTIIFHHAVKKEILI